MILLASVLLIIGEATGHTFSTIQKKTINAGFWITNISLFLFCLCLILAGIEKGKLVIENQLTFQAIMEKIRPWLVTFAFAGLGIFTGLLLVTVHPMLAVVGYLKRKKSSEEVPAELKLTIN